MNNKKKQSIDQLYKKYKLFSKWTKENSRKV